MTRPLTFLVLAACIACGTSADDAGDGDVIDDAGDVPADAVDTPVDASTDTPDLATDVPVDDADGDSTADAAEDTRHDGADSDSDPDTGPCADGESRTDGCETCYCASGSWECYVDEWCAYEECLAECPAECLPREEQPCGSSVEYFCTDCHLDCAGVTEVERAVCEDPTSSCGSLPPDAVPIEFEIWTPPDGCWLDEFAEHSSALIDNDGALAPLIGCDEPSGIDWETSRLALSVFYERPDAEVYGAALRGEELVVQMAARVYCGGPAPPNSAVLVLVEATPETLNVVECSYGACTGPPAP